MSDILTPLEVLWCPECGDFQALTENPGLVCSKCGSDSPAFVYTRTYPPLTRDDEKELNRIQEASA